MPSRNIIKNQVPNSYYHVYARGINRQKLFIESADYKYFLKLFERYLSEEPAISKTNEIYPNFLGQIEVLAYCLMTNHFHLLIYQIDTPYLEKLMRCVMTSYSRYFNLKYKRTGSVFESRYKAVRIDQESYLQHISRYIYLNPRLWEKYKYSSLSFYVHGKEPNWLTSARILELFTSRQSYLDFVSDYEEMRDTLHEIKDQLANK
ncbi:MAG: transposase [Candidatus Saccharibacteria bacterium]